MQGIFDFGNLLVATFEKFLAFVDGIKSNVEIGCSL